MTLLGIHLTLLIGPTVPVPAPVLLTENLESVEVSNTDAGRSGFQLTFKAGRSNPLGALEDPLLRISALNLFNRVILIVTFNVRPRVLMDGIITHQEFAPGNEPGTSTLTVTGEDVSVMMDQEDRIAEHPAQADPAIVAKLITKYARFGLTPIVISPKVIEPPLPVDRVPVQQGTDLEYIEELGQRHGHVFYVTPGPAPGVNEAYWGPPKRLGLAQRGLSVNFGGETNVRSLNFQHDARALTLVEGDVQDPRTNRKHSIQTTASLRPPLSRRPTGVVARNMIRREVFRTVSSSVPSALSRAQAMTDFSSDQVVTANGELDSLRYGDLLRARGLVGLRGAGVSYDGVYYVKEVSHSIRRGDYSQSFTLTRDGVGSSVPVIRT